jgi:hypothetical protein
MKIFTHGGSISNTYFQNNIFATKKQLIKVFGPLDYNDENGDKTTQEWVLTFFDGTIATIYDYEGDAKYHIGGHTKRASALVYLTFSAGKNDIRYLIKAAFTTDPKYLAGI